MQGKERKIYDGAYIRNRKLIYLEIEEWAKRNKLNKNEKFVLLECFRKVHKFNNGVMTDKMLIISVPSTVGRMKRKELLVDYSTETKGVKNWYWLGEKGIEIVKDLKIKWEGNITNTILWGY